MKYIALLFLFSMICLNTTYGQQTKKPEEINDFGDNPGNLKMFIHDNTADGANKLPLVVVLHGCGETANSVADLTGWNKLADSNDFIVLYPQQKFVNNIDLCFNWFMNRDIEKGRGESESILQMIIYAIENYPVDENRIFITGFSAGAAMSVVMTATHPEFFQSGAIFAGGAYHMVNNPFDALNAMLGKKKVIEEKLTEAVKEQNPGYNGKYPVLIIYQGFNDPVVNYKNAAILVNQWTGINNADTIRDKTEHAYMGIEDITRSEYTDASGRTIVVLYEVENLGHRILVKPGEKDNEGGHTGMFSVDKGFHSTYQTAKEFGIIKKKEPSEMLSSEPKVQECDNRR